MDEPPARTQDRATRLEAVLARDGERCVWCGRPFTRLIPPTTDHLVPRLKGGPSWLENEVAACRRCNGQRGHASPIDWFDECERRGWSPEVATIRARMKDLAEVIDSAGGQRRARAYLEAQSRRWARR